MILYIYVVVLLFLIVACMFLDPRHRKGSYETGKIRINQRKGEKNGNK